MKRFKQIVYLGGILLLSMLTAEAQAHGGGTLQVSNAPVGECLISVWVAPTTPRAKTDIHLTVGAAEVADNTPVLDAEIEVVVRDEQGQAVAQAAATTEQSINRLFYEADIPALAVGDYTVEIQAVCAGTTDGISFPLQVRPATSPWLYIIPIAATGLLLLGLVLRNWRRREPVHRLSAYKS